MNLVRYGASWVYLTVEAPAAEWGSAAIVCGVPTFEWSDAAVFGEPAAIRSGAAGSGGVMATGCQTGRIQKT